MKIDLNVDVHHLARVEGHGNIRVKVENGELREARWDVVETPRFFEVMLKGKHYTAAGILTARICGICSIGHCLASVRATENAFGITIPEAAARLRLLAKHGIPESRIHLMQRGIDTARFSPNGVVKEASRFRIVTSCRMSKDKRLDDLVPVVRHFGNRGDIQWVFIGDGPYRPEFQKALGDSPVEFTGFLMGDRYVYELRRADLFVFPSTDDTLGQTPLEAMACGVPVIVTDQGGPKDYVRHGVSGLVVKGKSPRDIIAGIESVLDKQKLRQMGRAAREWTKDKTLASAFKEFYACYTQPDAPA
jgi:glycosyltransferase involved in cell wall biosynthesis